METAKQHDQSRGRRLIPIIGLAAVFGKAAAWIKGNDIGLRDAIEILMHIGGGASPV